ncbi:LOW QUALITY PROTEIN: probable ATP-dependent RNA helicase DDX10 [Macrobrachium nipponense]|uniref:LOW QUALITY PROTEIN: probable ATP-dependent RNA helicase DDX10 n=1 Tax=Macrobrachium nipponense TaxID=159736 RepID=UPI0030C8BC2A
MEEASGREKMPRKNKNFKDKNFNPKFQFQKGKGKNQVMREEIEKLREMRTKLPEMMAEELDSFAKLPLSAKTLKGLKNAGFTVPTKVQRQTLLYSLGGCDVVAAAKTGSGKTLAFIIPILEKLYDSTWTHLDGVGAVVITPARELAYQIFDVLNKVGKEHDFSAGLVIGGTDLEFEWKRIRTCNIMICTPGRLVQHMTENPDFVIENVQILVLDEADMCLSMGFADSVNCILEELPSERQTLLFSATQTRDVKDLIRAGCRNPVFCSVHEHSKTATPKTLVESYVVCEAHEKFNFLWSFITFHKKQKILVFLSTCKQVKYIYNIFCKLQPGLSVMGLHGNMKQLKRMAMYEQFCRKKCAVLFATDVAARGLDIPAVHWVVQADCPEDVTTYIHRAGRTARYSMAGEALLILTPSEEKAMVANLKAKNIPIEKIFVDTNKQRSINVKVEIVLTKYRELKEDAVRAFKAYIKHIAQMRDKKVFNVLSVDRDAYACSLGLVVTPRIRFLEKLLKQKLDSSEKKKMEMNHTNGVEKYRPTTMDFGAIDSDEEEDDEFLVSSKNQPVVSEILNPDQLDSVSKKKKKKIVTKEDVAQKLLRKNIKINKISKFDDEGNAIVDPTKVQISDTSESVGPNKRIDINELKAIIQEEDKVDKKIHNARVKERKQEKKRKEKELRKQAMETKEEEKEVDEDEDSEDEHIDEIIDSLPDPDKIYGSKSDKRDNSESEESSDDDDGDNSGPSSSEEETDSEEEQMEKEPKLSGKRKAQAKLREAKRSKLAEGNTLSNLPMDEQEQLALFLLKSRK